MERGVVGGGDGADLKTMLKRLEGESYYITLDMFVADMRKIFHNCRTYKSPDTMYFKHAQK